MNTAAQQTNSSVGRFCPARLDASQAAWYLGFEPHEIPSCRESPTKPLGKPARNCTKYFATETLEQLRRDEVAGPRQRCHRRLLETENARKAFGWRAQLMWEWMLIRRTVQGGQFARARH